MSEVICFEHSFLFIELSLLSIAIIPCVLQHSYSERDVKNVILIFMPNSSSVNDKKSHHSYLSSTFQFYGCLKLLFLRNVFEPPAFSPLNLTKLTKKKLAICKMQMSRIARDIEIFAALFSHLTHIKVL